MKLHGNAALSWNGRRLLAGRVLEQGWTLTAAAAAGGVSVRCARKWVGRYRAEGEAGLLERSSAPRRVANRTPVAPPILLLAQKRLLIGLRLGPRDTAPAATPAPTEPPAAEPLEWEYIPEGWEHPGKRGMSRRAARPLRIRNVYVSDPESRTFML